MRRWFAILFLLFLPIQLSWAAVSAYCEHEAGAAADHLGHHEHKHQGEVDDESWPKGGGVDVDCSFCHAASCTALRVSAATIAEAQPIKEVVDTKYD